MSLQYARKDQDNKMGYVKRLTPNQRAAQLALCPSLFPDAEHIRDAYVDASNSEHALAVEVIDAWQFHAPVTLVETIDVNPTKGGVI